MHLEKTVTVLYLAIIIGSKSYRSTNFMVLGYQRNFFMSAHQIGYPRKIWNNLIPINRYPKCYLETHTPKIL